MRAILLSLVIIVAISASSAFIPTRFIDWQLNGRYLFIGSVDTHEDMTRMAMLQVAASILKDNPNPKDRDSTSRINSVSTLSERNLITAYHGKKDRGKTRNLEDAINEVEKANRQVDLNVASRKVAAAHFDSEQFEAGQRRLVEKYHNVLEYIRSLKYERARIECGRMFHTLQDFYSHSNWVENGNLNTLDALGQNSPIRSIAGPYQKTCRDCEIIVGNFWLSLNNIVRFLSGTHYCPNNLLGDTYLTSGYYGGQLDDRGYLISKPPGKCSHGGFLDSERDESATGGINKDSPYSLLSPHHYLFEEAARLATLASVKMLHRLRRDVGNDSLFSMFLGVSLISLKKASIAYVIDTTGSMEEEIREIQASIPRLRSNLEAYARNFADTTIIRYILVPYNDPDPGFIMETDDINHFLNEIRNLRASGGGDTPEPSIGATIRAIKASEPDSPVYVFTDALPSDGYRRGEALNLISKKNTRVNFALVNLLLKRKKRFSGTFNQIMDSRHSRIKRQAPSNVYEQLSTISGGQILNIDTRDLSELSFLVSSSAVRSRRTILRSSNSESATYYMPIDFLTLEVSISVSGINIRVTVLSPQGANAGSINEYSTSLNTQTSYISQLNVRNDTLRGNWSIIVVSSGFYSVQVFGISDLHIRHNIYKSDIASIMGFSELQGKPIQGETLIVIFKVQTDENINITRLNVVAENGANVQPINNLTTVTPNCYAGVFLPPNEAYIFQVIGLDSYGYAFSHFTDTAVQVSSVLLTIGERDRSSIVMRPGEESNTRITVHNYGEASFFSLSATIRVSGGNETLNPDNFVTYHLNSSSLTLLRNSSATVALNVTLCSEGYYDGLIVFIFSINAQSADNSDINNFIEIEVMSTPRPAPILDDFITSTLKMEYPVTTSNTEVIKAMLYCKLFTILIWYSLI